MYKLKEKIEDVDYEISYEVVTENTEGIEFKVELSESEEFMFLAKNYHLNTSEVIVEDDNKTFLNMKIASKVLSDYKSKGDVPSGSK